MLTLKKIDDALQEASRFIDRAIKAKQIIKQAEDDYVYSSKENSAMKRASLDLAMALVELRK